MKAITMNKPLRGMIFDCDGTLLDSLDRALESFTYALECIGEKPRPLDAITRYFGISADKIFTNLLGSAEQGQKAYEHYISYQIKLSQQTSLHQGIHDLLHALISKKIPLAIVTGRHFRDLEVVLKPHEIMQHFVTLIADSHLSEPKPSPEGILLAAARMELDPTEVVYVGDSPTDIEAAHAAGAHAIAALWDKHVNTKLLQQAGPHHMAKTPSEVWAYYQKKM